MALTTSHKITGSINGSYIIFEDTTLASDYVAEGIDTSTDVTSVDITITLETVDYVFNSTQIQAQSFVDSDLKLTPADFGLSTFEDNLYDVSIILNVTSGLGSYTSTSSTVLYGIVEQSALAYILNTDWKAVYRDITIYFDNSLKIKSWLNSIKLSNEFNLPSEGYRILKSLQKALS